MYLYLSIAWAISWVCLYSSARFNFLVKVILKIQDYYTAGMFLSRSFKNSNWYCMSLTLPRHLNQCTKHFDYTQEIVSIICCLHYNMTAAAWGRRSNTDPFHVHILLFISASCVFHSLILRPLLSLFHPWSPSWHPSNCLCRTTWVQLFCLYLGLCL